MVRRRQLLEGELLRLGDLSMRLLLGGIAPAALMLWNGKG